MPFTRRNCAQEYCKLKSIILQEEERRRKFSERKQKHFLFSKLRAKRFQFPTGHIEELTRHCRNELLEKSWVVKLMRVEQLLRKRIKKPDFLFSLSKSNKQIVKVRILSHYFKWEGFHTKKWTFWESYSIR